jgi:hypothetical protein
VEGKETMKKEVKDKLDSDLSKVGLMDSITQLDRYAHRHNLKHSHTKIADGELIILDSKEGKSK